MRILALTRWVNTLTAGQIIREAVFLVARRIGSTKDFQVDHRGQRLYRLHKHPCGHEDRCNLEHFAESVPCERCYAAVRAQS